MTQCSRDPYCFGLFVFWFLCICAPGGKKCHLFEPYLFSKINERTNNKQEQQRKRIDNEDAKKPIKRRRAVLSPKRAEDDDEPSVVENANYRDRARHESGEDNSRAVIERRKPSRESELRIEGQKTRIIDEDRDVGRRDDVDNDDKSEEASVECDINGIPGETDV